MKLEHCTLLSATTLFLMMTRLPLRIIAEYSCGRQWSGQDLAA